MRSDIAVAKPVTDGKVIWLCAKQPDDTGCLSLDG